MFMTINAPRVHDIPASDSPLAYNEDELVTVLTDIYKHFIEVAYLPERGLHLDARVISLLKRLPYVSPRKDFPECEWYPSAHVVNYLDPKTALRARDPAWLSVVGGGRREDFPNLDFMRPGDVALGLPANVNDYMFTLILDTAANSIRRLYNYCELPDSVDRAKLEVPEHEGHYRNQPAYHAPTFLCDYYSRLRSLEYVPFALGSYYIHGPCDMASSISANIMRQYYGWPDDFRRGAWREVADLVNDEAREAEEHWEQSLILRRRGGRYTEQTVEKATDEIVAKLGLNIV